MKDSKKLFKRLSLVGIGLCAACCLLPVVAVMFGIGTVAVLSGFLGWVGIAALILAAVFFAIHYFKSRRAPACDIDCECNPKEKIANQSQRI
jgi:hypothetical protein